jgi:transcriptional regulator GlxA family with amidase domain
MSTVERRLRIGILALEGCMMSSIASASDCLRVAQTLADIRAPNSGLKLETVLFGARGQERIHTSTGFDIGLRYDASYLGTSHFMFNGYVDEHRLIAKAIALAGASYTPSATAWPNS